MALLSGTLIHLLKDLSSVAAQSRFKFRTSLSSGHSIRPESKLRRKLERVIRRRGNFVLINYSNLKHATLPSDCISLLITCGLSRILLCAATSDTSKMFDHFLFQFPKTVSHSSSRTVPFFTLQHRLIFSRSASTSHPYPALFLRKRNFHRHVPRRLPFHWFALFSKRYILLCAMKSRKS